MKKLILAAALLAHLALSAGAAEAAPLPVQEGGNYILWYDAPANRFAGLKERRSFVRVLEIQGDWIRAEQFFSDGLAQALAIVEEIEKETELGKTLLAKMDQSKEAFLKEVKANPIPEEQRIELWINLQRVEAITRHPLKPKAPEQEAGGVQPATPAPLPEEAKEPYR